MCIRDRDKLKAMGAKLVGVETGRHGTNPLSDLQLMYTYKKILRNEKPDVVLTYNIKPNVYAVSYTHLDGYKRQYQFNAGSNE